MEVWPMTFLSFRLIQYKIKVSHSFTCGLYTAKMKSNRCMHVYALYMKQRRNVTLVLKLDITETSGRKFLTLSGVHRFVCGYILCILHKWNVSEGGYWDTGWVVKHVGQVSGFPKRRIQKWDAKNKTANMDPLLTFHVYCEWSLASTTGSDCGFHTQRKAAEQIICGIDLNPKEL
jgi:hypothetical protein